MSRKTLLDQYSDLTDHRTDIADGTKKQYKTDAKKILNTDDPLYGPGYRTVYSELCKLISQRFHEKKG